MKRVMVGVLVLAMFAAGCGRKNDCGPKRKAAEDAVGVALTAAQGARDASKRATEQAQAAAQALADGEKSLEERLKFFEQSMDCLAKQDCCKSVHKLDNPAKAQITSTLGDVLGRPGAALPAQVQAVIDPMKSLASQDLQSATAKDAEKFCLDARQHVTRIRQEAPAAWKAARTEAEGRTAEAAPAREAAERRATVLGQWADALRANQKVTIAGDDPADAAARDAVAAYNAACH